MATAHVEVGISTPRIEHNALAMAAIFLGESSLKKLSAFLMMMTMTTIKTTMTSK